MTFTILWVRLVGGVLVRLRELLISQFDLLLDLELYSFVTWRFRGFASSHFSDLLLVNFHHFVASYYLLLLSCYIQNSLTSQYEF